MRWNSRGPRAHKHESAGGAQRRCQQTRWYYLVADRLQKTKLLGATKNKRPGGKGLNAKYTAGQRQEGV